MAVLLFFTEFYSEEGRTFELNLVRRIKQQMSTDPTLRPEYPPPLGLAPFTQRATEVALGKSSQAIMESRVISAAHARSIWPCSSYLCHMLHSNKHVEVELQPALNYPLSFDCHYLVAPYTSAIILLWTNTVSSWERTNKRSTVKGFKGTLDGWMEHFRNWSICSIKNASDGIFFSVQFAWFTQNVYNVVGPAIIQLFFLILDALKHH